MKKAMLNTINKSQEYRSRNITIVLATIFVLLLFIAAFASRLQRSDSNTISENPFFIDSSGFRSYINQDYLFTFDYPATWRLGQSTSMGYPYVSLLDPIAQQQIDPSQTEIEHGTMITLSMTNAARYAIQPVTLSTLKEMFISRSESPGIYSDPDETYDVAVQTVGKITGVKLAGSSKLHRSETFAFIKQYKNESVVFEMSIIVFKSSEDVPNIEESFSTFQQILSSFTFTD